MAITGTYAPSGYHTLEDNNGNPVSGGLIWTYLAGLSTPVPTYVDVALTIPASNPIVTDDSGRWATFLVPGTSYKFVFEHPATPPSHGPHIRTVDNMLAVSGTANPTTNIGVANLRLSLVSGLPVSTADVLAATSIYVNPYAGNQIALYDGSIWNLRTLATSVFSVPSTINTLYDVFCYDNASIPTFETHAWTSDTARATALTLQDGIWVKTGFLTRRYIGSFRTTAVLGQTEDSKARRWVWNYYNRMQRPMEVLLSVSSYNYTLATWRQANADAANQLDFVIGLPEVELVADTFTAASNANLVNLATSIGENSTTTPKAGTIGQYFNNAVAGQIGEGMAALRCFPAAGRSYYPMLEQSQASGLTAWFGADAVNKIQSGIHGMIWG